MIATLINTIAVLAGGCIGLLFRGKLQERFSGTVHMAAGVVSFVAGIGMALRSTHPLALALALLAGGMAGTFLRIQDRIEGLGTFLHGKLFRGAEGGSTFAEGFLNSSVLFCAGAMTIVGSFNAGVKGDYDLILTKSALDGCMAILFAAASGPGVLFSAVIVLFYQGSLTLLSTVVQPFVSQLMLDELSGSGGALVIMIGLSLTGAAKPRTADFLPALAFTVALVALMPLWTLL